jgi:hypothetical protein
MVVRIAIIVGALSFAGIIVMLVVLQSRVSELAVAVSTLTRGEAGFSSEAPGVLATRVARLEAQIEQQQSPEPSGQGKAVANRKLAATADREERTALAQNTLRNVLQSDPGVRDQLRTAVREEQDRLDEESRSRWETSLAEGRRASLEELATQVHLSSVQVELLYDLLGTEREKMLEVFRRVREDGLSIAAARAQVELIRKATDKEVDAELDDDQFSGYEEMRPVYRVGGPPPGRR